MIRFTTPRQEFSFSINPQENFNRIVISYAQRGKIIIEKEKSDLTFSTDVDVYDIEFKSEDPSIPDEETPEETPSAQ